MSIVPGGLVVIDKDTHILEHFWIRLYVAVHDGNITYIDVSNGQLKGIKIDQFQQVSNAASLLTTRLA